MYALGLPSQTNIGSAGAVAFGRSMGTLAGTCSRLCSIMGNGSVSRKPASAARAARANIFTMAAIGNGVQHIAAAAAGTLVKGFAQERSDRTGKRRDITARGLSEKGVGE